MTSLQAAAAVAVVVVVAIVVVVVVVVVVVLVVVLVVVGTASSVLCRNPVARLKRLLGFGACTLTTNRLWMNTMNCSSLKKRYVNTINM